jgi:ATP sulfurylase
VAALFEKLGDIGIEPLFFDEVIFDFNKNQYREVHSGAEGGEQSRISGTAIRRYIAGGEAPPEWMMRAEVSAALLGIASQGRPIFEP